MWGPAFPRSSRKYLRSSCIFSVGKRGETKFIAENLRTYSDNCSLLFEHEIQAEMFSHRTAFWVYQQYDLSKYKINSEFSGTNLNESWTNCIVRQIKRNNLSFHINHISEPDRGMAILHSKVFKSACDWSQCGLSLDWGERGDILSPANPWR